MSAWLFRLTTGLVSLGMMVQQLVAERLQIVKATWISCR